MFANKSDTHMYPKDAYIEDIENKGSTSLHNTLRVQDCDFANQLRSMFRRNKLPHHTLGIETSRPTGNNIRMLILPLYT
jgi:hypothetical protein